MAIFNKEDLEYKDFYIDDDGEVFGVDDYDGDESLGSDDHWSSLFNIEKAMINGKSIAEDNGSPMEFKDSDGILLTSFIAVDERLSQEDLTYESKDIIDLLEDDEEMSDKENECEGFRSIICDNNV